MYRGVLKSLCQMGVGNGCWYDVQALGGAWTFLQKPPQHLGLLVSKATCPHTSIGPSLCLAVSLNNMNVQEVGRGKEIWPYNTVPKCCLSKLPKIFSAPLDVGGYHIYCMFRHILHPCTLDLQ